MLLNVPQFQQVLVKFIREALEIEIANAGGEVEEPLDDVDNKKYNELVMLARAFASQLLKEKGVMKEFDYYDPDLPENALERKQREQDVARMMRGIEGSIFFQNFR